MPGLLIYYVSYQFVSRSIESWFDVKVEGALPQGSVWPVPRWRCRSARRRRGAQPQRAAGRKLPMPLRAWCWAHRDQLGASDLLLWNAAGQWSRMWANRAIGRPGAPHRPAIAHRTSAACDRATRGFDELPMSPPGGRPNVRVSCHGLVPNPAWAWWQSRAISKLSCPCRRFWWTTPSPVQEAHREYQERALARGGLRRMYIGTLTLSLFLAVFGAVLLAVLLGNQLARPLLVWPKGARGGAGNLSPRPPVGARTRLGGLTRSFASMTQQLADARSQVERSMEGRWTPRRRACEPFWTTSRQGHRAGCPRHHPIQPWVPHASCVNPWLHSGAAWPVPGLAGLCTMLRCSSSSNLPEPPRPARTRPLAAVF